MLETTASQFKPDELVHKIERLEQEIHELRDVGLDLSKNTILFHRHNIRSKLRLKNKKINLRSHLLSFNE